MSKEIPLTKGYAAIVDDEDYEWLTQWKWYYSEGYAKRNDYSNGHKGIRMHRTIVGVEAGVIVDHINRDRLDNRRSNLRIATNQQSTINRNSFSLSTSRYKGVSWDAESGKWKAQIQCNHKKKSLGRYDNPVDAARAYDEAAKECFGEFAALNFDESK